jgi:hypothetical protein
MFVMVQVTEAGEPVPTDTVPAVNVFAPLDSVALNRPNVKPATSVATAPTAVAAAAPIVSRFLTDMRIDFSLLHLWVKWVNLPGIAAG